MSAVTASARTWLCTAGAKEGTSAPVAVSKAATRRRVCPSTVVKSPAAYTRVPSGEAASASTWPSRSCAKEATSSPVRMS